MSKHFPKIASFLGNSLATVIVLATLCSAFLNVFSTETASKASQISSELQYLNVINANISERNRALSRKVTSMREDRRFVETVAREELGMIRTGETLYIFPPEFDDKLAANNTDERTN